MLRHASRTLRLAAGAALLAACSAGSSHPKHEGHVQKGPFIENSNVDVQDLGTNGQPNGDVYGAATRNALGDFAINLPEEVRLVRISASGYFFNELTGSLSDAPITLNALSDVAGTTADIYVNIHTHLAERRVAWLMQHERKTFADARVQAEREVRQALPLVDVVGEEARASQINLLGGQDAASGYLLAASCLLTRAGTLASPESPDAGLQRMINDFAGDIAEDGVISVQTGDRLAEGADGFNPEPCRTHLQAFIDERGLALEAPDPGRAVDSDADGIVNAEDTDDDNDGVADEDDCNPIDPNASDPEQHNCSDQTSPTPAREEDASTPVQEQDASDVDEGESISNCFGFDSPDTCEPLLRGSFRYQAGSTLATVRYLDHGDGYWDLRIGDGNWCRRRFVGHVTSFEDADAYAVEHSYAAPSSCGNELREELELNLQRLASDPLQFETISRSGVGETPVAVGTLTQCSTETDGVDPCGDGNPLAFP